MAISWCYCMYDSWPYPGATACLHLACLLLKATAPSHCPSLSAAAPFYCPPTHPSAAAPFYCPPTRISQGVSHHPPTLQLPTPARYCLPPPPAIYPPYPCLLLLLNPVYAGDVVAAMDGGLSAEFILHMLRQKISFEVSWPVSVPVRVVVVSMSMHVCA